MTHASSTYRRLPDVWIQKIFSTMQAHYGAKWMNMWKLNQTLPNGEDVGVVNAMKTWAEKLAGFEEHPECIAHVLEGLPTEPPNLPQFLEMCRRAPQKEKLMLVHNLTPEDVKRNKERLDEIKQQLNARFAMSKSD